MGDSVGFAGAYWVLIVVPLIPISLYFVLVSVLVVKKVRSESVSNTVALRRDGERSETAGDVELQCIDNRAVQNPMKDLNNL